MMGKKRSLATRVLHMTFQLGILVLFATFVVQPLSVDAAQSVHAFIRIVHASPVAGSLDVYADGQKLLTDFTFGKMTGYMPLTAGAHRIQMAPTGKGLDTVVINQTISVDAGIAYTIAAIGIGTDSLGLEAFVDSNQMNVKQTNVRIYHLSPNAGPLNVAVSGNTIINALSYKNASGYLSLAPGSYTFNLTAVDFGTSVPVMVTLNAATVNSIFAVGLLKSQPALNFVLTTANGVPGLPGTGSDPQRIQRVATTSTPFLLWFLVSALLLIGSGVAVRRVSGKR